MRARSAAWLARTGGRLDTRGLRILFYHRVADDRAELAVSPQRFAEQMDYLASQSYRVVDVVTAADLLDHETLPPRTVGLSFDDGCLDVAEHAMPILARHGFQATVFVPPAVIDGWAWFDGYGRQSDVLDWDIIRELDRDGTLRFEALALTHSNLLALDEHVARHEIEGSKAALEARLERPVEAFAYPSGPIGSRERRLVREAGFRVAVSCEPGFNRPEANRLALRRRQIDAQDSLLDFRAKLGGGHDTPLPFAPLGAAAARTAPPRWKRALKKTAHSLTAPNRVEAAIRALARLGGGVALLAVFLGLGLVLSRSPLPLAALVAVGVGLLSILFLALSRFHAAVALGVLLLPAVRFEPAPTDLVFAVVIAVAFVTGRFAVDRVPLSVTLLVSAFLALNLLASIEAVVPAQAVGFFAITLYLCIFGIWLASYVDSSRRARLLVLAYLGAALGSSLLVLAALLLPIPERDLFLYPGGRGLALFKDPNVFGPFLVPAALIVLEELATPRLLRSRGLVKLAIFLLLSLGVLFSYSRAAWLNFAIGTAVLVLVLLLRRGGATRALKLLVILALATTALAAIVATTGSADFLEERARFQSYDVGRFHGQRLGLAVAEEYPLGIGPGQFEAVLGIAAHSTYVRTVAEQGVPGMLVLLGLMLVTLGFAARNAIMGRSTYGIGSAALLAAWCGLLANSFFIDTLHWRHMWLLAALIWAGAAIPRGTRGESPGRPRSRARAA